MAMRRAAYMTADPGKSAKLARLVEIVAECAANDRKVVIFSYFRRVLDVVAAALPEHRLRPADGHDNAAGIRPDPPCRAVGSRP